MERKIRKFLNTVEENGRSIKHTLGNLKSELDHSAITSCGSGGNGRASESGSETSDGEHNVMVMPDRKFFGDFLHKELLRCENYGYPLSIMRVEIRWRNKPGESSPNSVSETAIRECTRNLQACIRRSDKVAQLHNGQFFILLPETDETHSHYVLRRIGTKLISHNESCPETPLKIQIACASCKDQQEVRSALKYLLKSREGNPNGGGRTHAKRQRKIWN